jgi:hypothetical protein
LKFKGRVGKWKKEKTPPQHLVWFGFIPKQWKQTHPQIVHWWVLGCSDPLAAYHCCYTVIPEPFQQKFYFILFCWIFEILFIICAKILINQKFNCQDFQAQKLKLR